MVNYFEVDSISFNEKLTFLAKKKNSNEITRNYKLSYIIMITLQNVNIKI